MLFTFVATTLTTDFTYRCQVCHYAVSLVSATYKLRWIFESVSCAVLRQDDFVMMAMNFVVFSFHVIFWLNDFPSVIEAMTLVYCPFSPIHYMKRKLKIGKIEIMMLSKCHAQNTHTHTRLTPLLFHIGRKSPVVFDIYTIAIHIPSRGLRRYVTFYSLLVY